MLDGGKAGRIAELYRLGADPMLSGPVARGEQGQVWRLDTAAGAWAIKEPFGPVDEASAQLAADFQDAAALEGIRVPRPVRTPDGRVLADMDPQVRVYGWVDLRAPDLELDPGEVGALLAAIHQAPRRDPRLSGAAGPTDPWYTAPVGADGWSRLDGALQAARAPFAPDLAAMRAELTALDSWVEPPERLQLCHRDLFADNVRALVTGELCVIDWENCGTADPGYELGCALVEFCSEDPSRATYLYAAYVEAGGPGRVDQRGSFSMVIAVLGHIAELVCDTWCDPDTSALERGRTIGRFAEFSDRPLTRALVDDLLDAVAFA